MTCKLETLVVFETAQTLTLTDNNGAGVTISIAAGSYYWSSTADGGSRSLVDEIKLRLENGGALTYTVTLSDGSDSATGKLTIAVSAGTFAITWVSTTLRDLLGFSGNIAAAASATSDYHVKRLWLPNADPTPDAPWPAANGDPIGEEETDYAVTMAPSGAAAMTVLNVRSRMILRFENIYGYRRYKAHELADAAGAVNCSVQTWYRDLMDAGGVPFRIYPDRSSDAGYHTVFFDEETGGALRSIPMGPKGYVGARSLFIVEFRVRQYVHVS